MLKFSIGIGVLALPGCVTSTKPEEKIQTVEFFVNSNPDIGEFFDSPNKRFIRPTWVNESGTYEFYLVWRQFERGSDQENVLYCTCKGYFFERDGLTCFKVYDAKYFLDDVSRWKKSD